MRRYERVSNPSMRMEHKAGDQLLVDYTGHKLRVPGAQPCEVEVFVAILLTYAEAVKSQYREGFTSACENPPFNYISGIPRAIVPANPKSAVAKVGRHEAILNIEFKRFGEHYGMEAYPARAREPKDKSHIKNAVKLTLQGYLYCYRTVALSRP